MQNNYTYVAALDPPTASCLVDFLDAPPAANKYEGIRARLLDTFSLSEQQRARMLLNMPAIGDELPSAVMDRMLNLLGTHTPCFLFRQLFLDLLPNDIRTVLVSSGQMDSRELAKLADRLVLTRQLSTSAVCISAKQRFSPDKTVTTSKDTDLCWYHRKWGDKATNCKQPCSYKVAGTETASRQ